MDKTELMKDVLKVTGIAPIIAYAEPEQEAQAKQYGHSTFGQSAALAARAGAKRLWLVHYSPMITEPEECLHFAQGAFPRAECGFDGKQLTIPQLGPYKEDLDPAVRRAAYEAEAGYFDAHRAELDELYGKIVQNLNQQAHVLGYKDYSELSYVRMNRIGYGAKEIKAFRDQVANDVVPLLQKVMAMRAKRTGIEHPTFCLLYTSPSPRDS